ncbi:hypothetical protein ILYODFUR_000885 [Ilyodon furcidens]|uniref:Interleukin-2 n=1 Tax=Ilyodon furcidens TaxID=33524 RepID=A0ABV0SHG9_9TELE
MMKCVLIIVLLQFCCSFQLDVNLNNEIIRNLRELRGKVTFPKPSPIPGKNMTSHPSRCLGTFSKALRHLLRNVTQKKSVEIQIEKLNSNLRLLETHQQHESQCKMTNETFNPLNHYINFVKKLNNGR